MWGNLTAPKRTCQANPPEGAFFRGVLVIFSKRAADQTVVSRQAHRRKGLFVSVNPIADAVNHHTCRDGNKKSLQNGHAISPPFAGKRDGR